MNVVDSCGWLEYLANDGNAAFFAPAIENKNQLLVPTLTLFEVFNLKTSVGHKECAALSPSG